MSVHSLVVESRRAATLPLQVPAPPSRATTAWKSSMCAQTGEREKAGIGRHTHTHTHTHTHRERERNAHTPTCTQSTYSDVNTHTQVHSLSETTILWFQAQQCTDGMSWKVQTIVQDPVTKEHTRAVTGLCVWAQLQRLCVPACSSRKCECVFCFL